MVHEGYCSAKNADVLNAAHAGINIVHGLEPFSWQSLSRVF